MKYIPVAAGHSGGTLRRRLGCGTKITKNKKQKAKNKKKHL
jgi:hypothetical protein